MSKIGVDLGQLNYEWDNLEVAEEQLLKGIQLCEVGGYTEWVIVGLQTLAFVRQAQHDAETASDYMRQAMVLADVYHFVPINVHHRVGDCFGYTYFGWMARLRSTCCQNQQVSTTVNLTVLFGILHNHMH